MRETASKQKEHLRQYRAEIIKPERKRFEKLMSMYDEDGMEQEGSVFNMEQALIYNKHLTQQRNLKNKNI
ncbi:MAG: hypothetical protein JNK73_13015 [Bacteroidia bacterium]|nr:hypothetical protein [Bacteroidia bacterium]